MKRLFRYVCVLLAAFTLLSLVTVAGAAGTQVIDASHTSAGYVTVSYTSAARLKVGIQYGSGKTAYRDCPVAPRPSPWTRATAPTPSASARTSPAPPTGSWPARPCA